MGIDAMVMRAGGIFRDPGSFGMTNGNDGFNTFQFGSFAVNNAVTTGMESTIHFVFRRRARATAASATTPASTAIRRNR